MISQDDVQILSCCTTPIDPWSLNEILYLAASIKINGEDWELISHVMQLHKEPSHPSDWFTADKCRKQYQKLLKEEEGSQTEMEHSQTQKPESTTLENVLCRLTKDKSEEQMEIIMEDIKSERQKYMQIKLKEEVSKGKSDELRIPEDPEEESDFESELRLLQELLDMPINEHFKLKEPAKCIAPVIDVESTVYSPRGNQEELIWIAADQNKKRKEQKGTEMLSSRSLPAKLADSDVSTMSSMQTSRNESEVPEPTDLQEKVSCEQISVTAHQNNIKDVSELHLCKGGQDDLAIKPTTAQKLSHSPTTVSKTGKNNSTPEFKKYSRTSHGVPTASCIAKPTYSGVDHDCIILTPPMECPRFENKLAKPVCLQQARNFSNLISSEPNCTTVNEDTTWSSTLLSYLIWSVMINGENWDVASKVILMYKDVHQPPEMFSAEKCKQQYYDLKHKGELDMERLIDENIDITEILKVNGNLNKVAVSTSSSAKHSTSPIPLKPALMSVVCENRIPEEMKNRTCRKGSETRETQRWVLTDHSKQNPKLPVNASNISDENIKSQYSTSSKKLMSEGLHSKLLTVPNNDFEILHIEQNIHTKNNIKRWDSHVKDIKEISFLNTDVLEESSRVEIDHEKNKKAYKAEAKGLLQRKKQSLEGLSINLPVQVNPKVNMQKPFAIIQNKELSKTSKTPEQVVEELNDGECEIIFECIRGKITERAKTLVKDVKESLTQALTPEIKDVDYELTEDMRINERLASIFPTIFGNSSEKVRVEFKEDFQTYTAIELQNAEFSEVSKTSDSVENYLNQPLPMNQKKKVSFQNSQNDIYIHDKGSPIKENKKKDSLKDNPENKFKKSVICKPIIKNTYVPTKEIMKQNINQGDISVTFETNDYQETQPVEEESCVRQGEVDYSVTNWMEQLSLVKASDYPETCSVVAESCVSKEGSDYLVLDNMRKLSFVDTSDDYQTQLVVKDSCISKESNSLTTDFVPGSEYLQTQPVLIVCENECEESLIKVLELTPKMNDLKFKEDIEIVWQKSPALTKKPITKTDLCSRISSEDDNHTVLEDTCRKVKSQEECHFQGQPYLKEIVQNISLNDRQYFLEETVTTREMKESSVSNEEPDLTIKALMRKYECKENIEHPCKTFSLEGEMRNAEILKQNTIWEENNNDKKKDNLNYKKKHIEEQTKIILQNQGASEQKLKSMNKSLMFLYNQLTEFKNAQIFKKPVTEEEAPDYKSIILRPMDFPTIKKNIQTGAISNITQLENDVVLMIDNAILYNPCTHIVHKMAKEMRGAVIEFFELKIVRDMLLGEVNLKLHLYSEAKQGAISAFAQGSGKLDKNLIEMWVIGLEAGVQYLLQKCTSTSKITRHAQKHHRPRMSRQRTRDEARKVKFCMPYIHENEKVIESKNQLESTSRRTSSISSDERGKSLPPCRSNKFKSQSGRKKCKFPAEKQRFASKEEREKLWLPHAVTNPKSQSRTGTSETLNGRTKTESPSKGEKYGSPSEINRSKSIIERKKSLSPHSGNKFKSNSWSEKCKSPFETKSSKSQEESEKLWLPHAVNKPTSQSRTGTSETLNGRTKTESPSKGEKYGSPSEINRSKSIIERKKSLSPHSGNKSKSQSWREKCKSPFEKQRSKSREEADKLWLPPGGKSKYEGNKSTSSIRTRSQSRSRKENLDSTATSITSESLDVRDKSHSSHITNETITQSACKSKTKSRKHRK